MQHRKPIAVFAVLILLVSLTLNVASAAVSPLVEVSGPSPLAACTLGGPGTNYVNAEVEPWVAVNPAHSGNLISAWQQDRWSNGGSHGLVAGYSFDGGATWGQTSLPFSACVPGGLPYERASDPWVSIGPDGKAYTISISFNQTNNNNAVGVATSSDGGVHWANLQTVIADTGNQFFNDKESITADPLHAVVDYAIWDRLASPGAGPDAQAFARSASFHGPTYFSRTTDGGLTWSPAHAIYDPGTQNQTIANQIVVLPDGTLVDIFTEIFGRKNAHGIRGAHVSVMRSTDMGLTWSGPIRIADLGAVGVTIPGTGEAVRTGDIIPDIAADPVHSGTVYAVWQDASLNNGVDGVVLSKSTDGGLTWSAPSRVNQIQGVQAFTASVDVNSNGLVGITYYDFRNDTGDPGTALTDYWFVSYNASGNFLGEQRVTPTSFDMRTAPNARGFFVGDYEGLDHAGASFKAFFVAANSGNTANRTDAFSTNITVP